MNSFVQSTRPSMPCFAQEGNHIAIIIQHRVQAECGYNAVFGQSRVAAVVKQNHPGNGEYLLVPGTEHGFLKAQSYSEVASWLDNPAKRDKVRNSYNPEVGRLTLQWLEKVRKN